MEQEGRMTSRDKPILEPDEQQEGHSFTMLKKDVGPTTQSEHRRARRFATGRLPLVHRPQDAQGLAEFVHRTPENMETYLKSMGMKPPEHIELEDQEKEK